MAISLSNFADRVGEIMPVIIKEFSRQGPTELYKGKITLQQYLVLNFLTRGYGVKMSDLARFMRVTTAAMTGIVDRLVKSGYAVRDTEPGDRRIIMIKTTRKGLGLVKKVGEERKKMVMDIFGKLAAPDRENYLKILMKVKEILVDRK